MSGIELLFIILIAAIFFYWLDGVKSKEIATSAGAQLCKRHDVYFLDQTVVLLKTRLRRNAAGQVVFYRQYGFEFTSDGTQRYRGTVRLLGKQPVSSEMEAYRSNSPFDSVTTSQLREDPPEH